MAATPKVGVLVASPTEFTLMRQAVAILERLGVPNELREMSSSRNPDLVDEYARTAFERGLKVLICTTGISGHLAAAVAARTVLPVIGVPIVSDPRSSIVEPPSRGDRRSYRPQARATCESETRPRGG
mgnify:CR=1 FL=1